MLFSQIEIIWIAAATIIILFLLASIWVVFDINRFKSLSRERKHSLTYAVARWPIYGVLYYIFKVRPSLKED